MIDRWHIPWLAMVGAVALVGLIAIFLIN